MSKFKKHGFLLGCVLLTGCASSDLNSQQDKAQAAHLNTELGMQYFALHDNILAQEKLQKALVLDPQSAEANAAMGYFLWKTGQPDQAKAYYQTAIYLSPNDPGILNAEGVYLCGIGKPELGIQDFLKAVKTPNFSGIGLTYQNAGVCAYQSGSVHDSEAKFYFQKALLADSLLPLADLKLAEIYFSEKNYSKAEFYLKQFNQIADPTAESQALSARLGLANAED